MGKSIHPRTIWIDIKKQIEFAIINGIYKNACKMPSISELSEEFSCGKSTAQKVLEEMYKEGTVTKQKGVGYFVKPFVREKLIEKYTGTWENDLIQNIKEAKSLGIEVEILKTSVLKMIGDFYYYD